MPVLCAGLAAYIGADSASVPTTTTDTLYQNNFEAMEKVIISLTAALGVVIGLASSHLTGKNFTPASRTATFQHNILKMSGKLDASTGEPSLRILKAMRMFTPVAMDHGQTNSNLSLMVTASSLAHPYSALISALMSAYGSLHFGAQEMGYHMLEKLQGPGDIEAFLERKKKTKERIHGFGHRSFKTADTRLSYTLDVLEELGGEATVPLLTVAKNLVHAVENDDYFRKRSLKPNGDIYGLFVFVAMFVQFASRPR